MRKGIKYRMKLLDEFLSELGGDTLRAVTVIPGFCAYLKSVKGVAELTPEKIVLLQKKSVISVEGENLKLDGYFEQDVLITGAVKKVEIC